MPKLSLIIPAYNEAEGIDQTSAALRPILNTLRQQYDTELIFVDDGSIDQTANLLRAAFQDTPGVKIISHDRNRKLGAALRTGFQNATGDIVITTDFDGTYSFNLIPQLLSQLVSERVDIVTASPYHPQGHVDGVPGYRLVFSFGASFLYRLLVQWNIHTWTALFRAYRHEVIESVPFESDDFVAGTELLVNAIRAGYKVSEFPATLTTRKFGQSSIKIARVTLAHLKVQRHLLWLRLTGHFTIDKLPAQEDNSGRSNRYSDRA